LLMALVPVLVGLLCVVRIFKPSSFWPSFWARFVDDAHHRVVVRKTPAVDAQLKLTSSRVKITPEKIRSEVNTSWACMKEEGAKLS